MDESDLSKQKKQNVTVNFENLHANMALNSPSGDAGEQEYKGVGDGVNTGEKMQSGKTGEEIQKGNTGEEMQNGNTGDEMQNGNTGDFMQRPDSNAAEHMAEAGDATQPPCGGNESKINDVAMEMIKNALDGAKEQISREGAKERNSSDEARTSTDKDEWMDILGNGFLKKKILKKGEGPESRPMRENEVTIKFESRLKNSSEVIESSDRYVFVLGEQDVLPAFDLSVALMQKGEIAVVESDARYAYGEKGDPSGVPPNAEMIFEIELLEVSDGPFGEKYDLERRLKWADEKRLKGNTFYTDKSYGEAANTYTRAIKALEKGWIWEESDEARIKINELRLKCYNNLTVSQMKLQKWKEAFDTCRAAEKLQPNNVKTLFRKGRIHCELGELNKGVAALSKAAKLEPEDRVIANELARVSRKLEKQKESQKNMYRRMLGTKPDKNVKKSTEGQRSWMQRWGLVMGGTVAVGVALIAAYLTHKTSG